MADLSDTDIRAAVGAGIIDEAQASKLLTIAQKRQGYRANMPADDEPFELFKGFSEIFITVGLGILFSGIIALSGMMGAPVAIPIVTAILVFAAAGYFTIKRRMMLPSIALASAFAASVAAFVSIMVFDINDVPGAKQFLTVGVAGAVAMLGYFAVYRVPFALFLFGLFGLGIAVSLAGMVSPESVFHSVFAGTAASLFDLSRNPTMAIVMLSFGIVAFVGGMYFDTRDPHRVSRLSACGFWLHILAAPAIVNVVVLTLLNRDSAQGYLLAAAALTGITLVALIIDRRSFLTAGIAYIGIILTWVLSETSADWDIVWTLLIMGVFITAIGTWWSNLRNAVMRALPNFPFKDRLPPYA
ncbi:hypothetical protein [Halovulum sp. GXIMD14793]